MIIIKNHVFDVRYNHWNSPKCHPKLLEIAFHEPFLALKTLKKFGIPKVNTQRFSKTFIPACLGQNSCFKIF
jgi:hypothetical protein